VRAGEPWQTNLLYGVPPSGVSSSDIANPATRDEPPVLMEVDEPIDVPALLEAAATGRDEE
jgi:hypothetical protein